ncbi:hypothetical protein [Caballeronia sp. GAWG2-1]|uniref:hypothetical protein n=1 Tax=Caballeronia sp. GAWG2-1 TaxID=2921744 RepID=UPI00202992EF|nr:hypothetical protein [Caballeronia sp. GAWG2-1]
MNTTITDQQLNTFRRIEARYGHLVKLPSAGFWRTWSEDDIWIRVVSQVVVVGNEQPRRKLYEPANRDRLQYGVLCRLRDDQVSLKIGHVLRDIATRYVSAQAPEQSQKVRALVKNLRTLDAFEGGPIGFIDAISKLDSGKSKVKFVEDHLAYIKSKGARDFLTSGLGLVTDCIALDSRVMGVVRAIVPGFPEKPTPDTYDELEQFLVREICAPLQVTPAHLDQLLFRFSDDILSTLH